MISGLSPNGFVNNAFSFADSVQQAPAATPLGDANGVDRVSRTFFATSNTGSMTAAAIVAAGAPVATGASLAENVTLGAYASAAVLADALGNTVAVPVTALSGGPLFAFGVSNAAPTLSLSGSAAQNGQYGASTTTLRTVAGTATSVVGFGRNALRVSVTHVSPAGTRCTGAADVVDNSANGTADVITGATSILPCPFRAAGSVGIDPTTAPAGVYTVSVRARDVAQNESQTLTRTFTIDRTGPAVGAPTASPLAPLGGQALTLAAPATDNFALVSQFGLVAYATSNAGATTPSIPEVVLRYDGASLGSAFAAPFTQSAALSITIPQFIRAIAMQTPSSANTYTATASQAFGITNGAAVAAVDAGGNAAYGAFPATAFRALLSPTQPTPTPFGGSGLQSVSLTFTPNNGPTTSTLAAPYVLSASTGPTALTITLRQNGMPNTPFTSPSCAWSSTAA